VRLAETPEPGALIEALRVPLMNPTSSAIAGGYRGRSSDRDPSSSLSSPLKTLGTEFA
jgi:hypothetical protein